MLGPRTRLPLLAAAGVVALSMALTLLAVHFVVAPLLHLAGLP